jgi:hypothetical protein
VRGLVTVQSPYGGSPVAADLLAEPTLARAVEVILERLVGAPRGAALSRPNAVPGRRR